MELNKFFDPLALPDWRWRRAQHLIKNGGKPSTRSGDDIFVYRAFSLMENIRDCEGEGDLFKLSLKKPVEVKAYDLFMDNRGQKALVEAMSLCADLAAAEEAEHLGVTAEVVETYEKLFYDVREQRHENPGAILVNILKPAMRVALTNTKDTDFVWKFMAFEGGYDVLEACWRYNVGNPEKVRAFHKENGITAMFKNFGIAQHMRPVNDRFSIFESTQQLLSILELEIKEVSTSGNPALHSQSSALKTMIEAAQFAVVDLDREIPDGGEYRMKDLLASQMTKEAAVEAN